MKRKKMYRKIIFGAGICIFLTACFPLTMAICLDQIIVIPGGPYQGIVNETVEIRIEIIDGVSPFVIFIDWGDGTNITFTGINDRVVILNHIYSKEGIYFVKINVTDSENNTDWSQTTIIITKIKCDLGIEIETDLIWCTLSRGTEVIIRVIVKNYSEKDFCDDYNITVFINPGNRIISIKGRPIGPGGIQIYLVEEFLLINEYIVFATLSSNCGDDNPHNDKSSELIFFVFPKWFCDFLDKLKEKANELLDDFPDWLMEFIKVINSAIKT